MKEKRVYKQPEDRYLDELEKKVRNLEGSEKFEYRRTRPGEEKMSNVLLDFMSPYLKSATDRESFERLIIIGIAAWNSAIQPEPAINDVIKEFAKKMSIIDRFYFRRFLKVLVKRKNQLYPENKRFIVSYQVIETGSGWHVSVISTLTEDI